MDGIAHNPRERAFTAAIVSLAASLGKGTVAEGIETAGQYAQLLKLGVEFGQGYLFARPVEPRRHHGHGCPRAGSRIPTRLIHGLSTLTGHVEALTVVKRTS